MCNVPGCDKPKKYGNGLCGMHWTRAYRAGKVQRVTRAQGTGSVGAEGYVTHTVRGRRVGEHVLVAEVALGRTLPSGAQVHHVDGNPLNNAPGNLVVCPSAAYHALLHARTRALAECGHADWSKCWICKQYAPIASLQTGSGLAHAACVKRHAAAYYQEKKRARTARGNASI